MRLWAPVLWVVAAVLLPAAPKPVDFQRDVHPILAAKCFACHSGDKRFGGLSTGTYRELLEGGKSGKAIDPGSSAGSLLMRRVRADGVPPMPPAGPLLSAAEVAALARWIDDGARPAAGAPAAPPIWKPRLSLSRPPVPAGSAAHPADRFIESVLRERGETPPAPVSDAAFARRVHYDVWGLPPSPEELGAFLADSSPDKRARLVARLLADSTRYADHWMSFWNDLLRNDEGVNYAGTRKSISPWLRKALEENLRFDEFTRRLIDPRETPDPDGFLIGVNWRGDVNASQTPVMQAAQNTSQIFLGVNMKCNSCHDSFINRWKLKDAYGLAAFFSDEPLELVRCDSPLGEYAAPIFPYPELGAVSAAAPLAEKRDVAARLFTARENGRFARTVTNRIWKRLMGRGIVEPADDMDAEPWSPELLDWLAAEFVSSGYDLKALIGTILTSQAYQWPVAEPAAEGEPFVFRGPAPRRLTAEQFIDTLSAITGEWRVRVTGQGKTSEPVREWRLASSPLTRALGRPIRDQVFTERNEEATTLQALEVVNGGGFARYLDRAARAMAGRLPDPPANRFDSGQISSQMVECDIDVADLDEVRLIVHDVDSYSPERVKAVWALARWVTADGREIPVEGSAGPAQLRSGAFGDALRAGTPSEQVFRIAGKGYKRLRAWVGVEADALDSDINPRVRFFVFGEKPDPERLVRVAGEAPTSRVAVPASPDAAATRIFRHALSRDPSAQEMALARELLGNTLDAQGVADLLWCVAALPEFQYLQ
ncbi:MAG: PSD1 domain-containing protein [Bryobacterales bacterium]|nr:PSD1 domain-containing protein [Bryobacterales bacterium]